MSTSLETPKDRVAMLFGGQSGEHDVSVDTGRVVYNALVASANVWPIYIARDGGWRLHLNLGQSACSPAEWKHRIRRAEVGFTAGAAVEELRDNGVRCSFLALHGPYGEDGRIQGLLEMAGIPYTGSGVLGSALAMNKALSKRVLQQVGISCPKGWELLPGVFGEPDTELNRLIELLGLPLVVKPMELGSSVGTQVCKDPDVVRSAVATAWEFGPQVLLEQYVEGRELTCGVLDLGGSGRTAALPPTLIRPRTAEFFDYQAKYSPGATEEITPAPVEAALIAKIQELALRTHWSLGLSGYSRVDFIERQGEIFVLEANTLPGMTQTSLFPQAAAVAGLEFTELLLHLIALGRGESGAVREKELTGCLVGRRERAVLA